MKQISQKDLLYSTGKYIQYHIIIYIRKESEKVYMCVYTYTNICVGITKSLCCMSLLIYI